MVEYQNIYTICNRKFSSIKNQNDLTINKKKIGDRVFEYLNHEIFRAEFNGFQAR